MHCEECLALSILLNNNIIKNGYIDDKPNIRSKDENIEVCTAIEGGFSNQLLFGDIIKPKQKYITDVNKYECKKCNNLNKCKHNYKNDISYCEYCNNERHLFTNGFMIIEGETIYNNTDHPTIIPFSIDLGNHGYKNLYESITKKEKQSEAYLLNKPLSLFIFYEWEISCEILRSIKSNVFKNIYIYSISIGQLYKNGIPINNSQHTQHQIKCYNTKCQNYRKVVKS